MQAVWVGLMSQCKDVYQKLQYNLNHIFDGTKIFGRKSLRKTMETKKNQRQGQDEDFGESKGSSNQNGERRKVLKQASRRKTDRRADLCQQEMKQKRT